VKYAYIATLKEEHAILRMCHWLQVSRSGYYKSRHRTPSFQSQRRAHVHKAVVLTFNKFKKRYGAPRITVELNESGIQCSRNHIAELMAGAGLKARCGKNFRYSAATNKGNHVSENLLKRNFHANKPNEKWVSDITYIRLNRGFVYLAVIMDLFSRQIIGWALDTTMTTDLITQAFDMAVASRKTQPGLILHSDQGVQYRSGDYQARLLNAGIRPSMSRKGNCWDNAAMESFFARLKVESVYAESYQNKDEAYASVFEYIELFYNNVRRHSANEYKSPKQYEQEYYARCA